MTTEILGQADFTDRNVKSVLVFLGYYFSCAFG